MRQEMHHTNILEIELINVRDIDSMGPFYQFFGNLCILVVLDYISKWTEAILTLVNLKEPTFAIRVLKI